VEESPKGTRQMVMWRAARETEQGGQESSSSS
jgi:hypothetical protein